jgi:NADH-quinone oxidoreductase subunit J
MTDPAAVVAFWALAVLAIVAALGVVVSRNLFHSAIFLIGVFLCVAGLYLVLSADFLFAVQIMVYAGAIAVLVVFAVMLTQQVERGNPENIQWPFALFVSIALFGIMAILLSGAVFPENRVDPPAFPSTEAVARGLFGLYVMPFEIASVLLLAAMVGAIVLAREDQG